MCFTNWNLGEKEESKNIKKTSRKSSFGNASTSQLIPTCWLRIPHPVQSNPVHCVFVAEVSIPLSRSIHIYSYYNLLKKHFCFPFFFVQKFESRAIERGFFFHFIYFRLNKKESNPFNWLTDISIHLLKLVYEWQTMIIIDVNVVDVDGMSLCVYVCDCNGRMIATRVNNDHLISIILLPYAKQAKERRKKRTAWNQNAKCKITVKLFDCYCFEVKW